MPNTQNDSLTAALDAATPTELWNIFETIVGRIRKATYPEVTITPATDDTALEPHCPYKGCTGTEFYDVDQSTRWLPLSEPEVQDGVLYLEAGDVDNTNHTIGYTCQECGRPVSLPANREITYS